MTLPNVSRSFQEGLNSRAARWLALLAALSLVGGVILLCFRLPFPAIVVPALLMVRYNLLLTLALLLALFFITLQIRGWQGETLNLTLVICLALLAMLALWGSGETEPAVLSGFAPINEPDPYFLDAIRLNEGSLFSTKTSMRPLFAGLLAFLFMVFNLNLKVSLLAVSAICAAPLYLFVREIRSTHGAAVAAAAAAISFFHYRWISETLLTENLGFALGMLGAALLWRSLSSAQRWLFCAGVFVVSLALNVRPGPFIVLVSLFLFGLLWAKQKGFLSRWFILAQTGAIIAGFAVNILIVRATAASPTVPFANFSYAVYGLVVEDGNFSEIFNDHPEAGNIEDNIEQTGYIYQKTLEEFLKNPGGVVVGSIRRWGLFFNPASYHSLFGFIMQENGREDDPLLCGVRIVLGLLSLVCVAAALKNRRDPYLLLALLGMAGVILSVPLVPPGFASRMRLYMAVTPFLVLPLLMGFAFIIRQKAATSPAVNGYRPLLAASAVLVALVVIAPFAVLALARPSQVTAPDCPGQEAIVARYPRGTALRLVAPTEIRDYQRSEYNINFFNEYLHKLPNDFYVGEFETLEAPATILHSVDLLTGDGVWVLFNSEQDMGPGISSFCGVRSSSRPEFFYAIEVIKQ